MWLVNEILDIYLLFYNGEGNDGMMYIVKWFIQVNGVLVYYFNGVKVWIDYKLYSDENEVVDIDLLEKVVFGESFLLMVEMVYLVIVVLVEYLEFNVILLCLLYGNIVW